MYCTDYGVYIHMIHTVIPNGANELIKRSSVEILKQFKPFYYTL